MHISRVELENFKSHAHSVFEFERGTTSITGENGAGKTSIIEAVAWAMFDTLDYKKEDIIRRGSKKATVRVNFESGLDEREYTVYRDSGAGYNVYDPHLKVRIADKKEEVTRFLWQHLAIEPGTDLESLFRHAIGVPQGTFTAIFLAAAAERRRTFDTLLKVEEYRRDADELLKTVRFVEQRMADVSVKIARAEGEIARIDLIEQEQRNIESQIGELTGRLEQLRTAAAQIQQSVAKMDEVEARLSEMLASVERLRGELAKAELVFKHRETDLARSREAAARVTEVKDDAAAYQGAVDRLTELERQRVERQKLRDELGKTETTLTSVFTEQKHLREDIKKFQRAHSDLRSLAKLSSEQSRLERQIEAKRRDRVKAEAAADQLKTLETRLVTLRETYRNASEQLATAKEKGLGAAQLEVLQKRDVEIVRELANANAALERDERFQKEIKNGLCPILSAKCLNLQEGETLEGFISSQFGELRIQIDELVTEQQQVGDALKAARESERFGAQVSMLESRVREIGDEGTGLKTQKAEIEKEAGNVEQVKKELERLEADLKALDNPKAKVFVLEKVLRREAEVREKVSQVEKNIERLESERRITVEKLESYKDFDVMYDEACSLRDRTADAYRILVANESAAAQVADNEASFEAAKSEQSAAAAAVTDADAVAKEAAGDYDREFHASKRAELTALERQQTENSVVLEAARKRKTELESEIERLSEIRRLMQDEFREKERLQKVAETTDFIRSMLKEAAPLVARNYVHHVSLEANQMFREIKGDAECTLTWTDDYGIMLEEYGYNRPFQSLSGGEQMAAALAIRLALLKQLSNIHIAFFDEPTTNMDAERRENLAQQIGRIGHFDQLFVISHDDTFEGYMDHEVRVESGNELHLQQSI